MTESEYRDYMLTKQIFYWSLVGLVGCAFLVGCWYIGKAIYSCCSSSENVRVFPEQAGAGDGGVTAVATAPVMSQKEADDCSSVDLTGADASSLAIV